MTTLGLGGSSTVAEVEHVIECCLRRYLPDPPPIPLTVEEDVLDKARDGSLIGDRGVEVVLLCPRRDDQEGLTRTIAAAALSGRFWTATPGKAFAVCCADAETGSVERLCAGGRPVHEVRQMIIPTIGVIVGDDDRGPGPERRFLDGVDGVDDECRLIERIGV